jgi:hypothetical protein
MLPTVQLVALLALMVALVVALVPVLVVLVLLVPVLVLLVVLLVVVLVGSCTSHIFSTRRPTSGLGSVHPPSTPSYSFYSHLFTPSYSFHSHLFTLICAQVSPSSLRRYTEDGRAEKKAEALSRGSASSRLFDDHASKSLSVAAIPSTR